MSILNFVCMYLHLRSLNFNIKCVIIINEYTNFKRVNRIIRVVAVYMNTE